MPPLRSLSPPFNSLSWEKMHLLHVSTDFTTSSSPPRLPYLSMDVYTREELILDKQHGNHTGINTGGTPGFLPPIFTISSRHIVQIFKAYSNTLSPVPKPCSSV